MPGVKTEPGCVPVLYCKIPDRIALGAVYMPFFKGGGLFIPGLAGHTLGDDVFVIVSLMNEQSRYALNGKVAWISPGKLRSGIENGAGIRFTGGDNRFRTKAEQLLAGQEPGDGRSMTAW